MNYKKAMIMFSLMAAMSAYIVFAMTFLSAYLNADKAAVININNFGEAHIEFLLLVVPLPIVLYSLLKTFDIIEKQKIK